MCLTSLSAFQGGGLPRYTGSYLEMPQVLEKVAEGSDFINRRLSYVGQDLRALEALQDDSLLTPVAIGLAVTSTIDICGDILAYKRKWTWWKKESCKIALAASVFTAASFVVPIAIGEGMMVYGFKRAIETFGKWAFAEPSTNK